MNLETKNIEACISYVGEAYGAYTEINELRKKANNARAELAALVEKAGDYEVAIAGLELANATNAALKAECERMRPAVEAAEKTFIGHRRAAGGDNYFCECPLCKTFRKYKAQAGKDGAK